jgi:adenine-specific DNA-methyltransferase
MVGSEAELAAVCVALGAPRPVSAEAQPGVGFATSRLEGVRAEIRACHDPLGDALCRLRSPEARRPAGATYTPGRIVEAMTAWAARTVAPLRVVDPGCGSGRFLLAAGRTFPNAHLLGIEIDPLAALIARANLAVLGLADRAEVVVADYRAVRLDPVDGPTLFLGNPPYVRHHQIAPRWKEWLTRTASARGLRASQLAGLHVHFFLATLQHTREGDVGCFITASEWLDVNYGRLVRDVLTGPLGLVRLDVLDPKAEAFEDALTTAVIAGFQVGSQTPSVHLRRVSSTDDLGRLEGGDQAARHLLAGASRWTPLTRRHRRGSPDLVELGELCRVHRGQVTGSNEVWIAGENTPRLPSSVLLPAITRAKELFAAGPALGSIKGLRRVIDLPDDLDRFSEEDRPRIEIFLRWARKHRAHESYIASHRSPWWAVRLRGPAPVLATYMARRPPAFVQNRAGARHINIAHGLYPRERMTEGALDELARYLAATVSTVDGRTYAGGLTKFEPKEMERLLVPTPLVLAQMVTDRRAA